MESLGSVSLNRKYTTKKVTAKRKKKKVEARLEH